MDLKNIERPAGNVPAREIPPLPGGGSWTFNESAWQWEESFPQGAGAANNTIDQEQ